VKYSLRHLGNSFKFDIVQIASDTISVTFTSTLPLLCLSLIYVSSLLLSDLVSMAIVCTKVWVILM
jgi:hypothetical protein